MTSNSTSELATRGTVHAVLAGPIRALRSPRTPDGETTAWKSAILKGHQTDGAHVGALGLAGDNQKEKKHHGGPTKAVLIYGAAHYAMWQHALRPHAEQHADKLRTMSPAIDASVYGFGAFGENLTIDGVRESTVCLGDIWQIGECVLQITEPRGPCATLTRRWMRPALLDEVRVTAAAGWYNAVLTEGAVRTGDCATLVTRIQTEWTLERVFHLLEGRVVSRQDVERLCESECAHAGLRQRLSRRLLMPGRMSG